MKVGRRIFYKKDTDEFLRDSGERSGYVGVTTPYEDFPEFNPATMYFTELSYGEIPPFLSVALDKQQIHATGIDTATLTVSVPDPQAVDTITVAVNGKTYSDALTNGQAVFTFTCAVEGTYRFMISSTKHGSGSATVEVIT